MTFEVPASQASIKQNQFEFKIPGERKGRSLPKMEFLPLGIRNRMAQAAKPLQAAEEAGRKPSDDELEAMGQVQLDLLERYSPGVTDALDETQLSALLVAWQEASGISVGGIASLCLLLDNEEQAEAIEYDLLVMGRRLGDLGTPALSWRDLQVVVRQAGPGSALARALDPEMDAWTSGAVVPWLLATVVDLLAGANWQRAGKKSAPKPKPIPRPGSKSEGTRYGSKPIPVADFDDWWNNQGG
ncbi:tail assembly chaperone [Arthrobacter phage Galaxy]|uniref:Tail assembly chaperone n=1 Tax=Arthrobacter phage Galaxy TaxID=1772326 RepID=A0A0U4B2C5_9CAUD|nr:tail assembly chaperone [Arthrobacter phage Galaxy]ALY08861.1 tail assembly chaperone [Arthrobacter phage Galaxy]